MQNKSSNSLNLLGEERHVILGVLEEASQRAKELTKCKRKGVAVVVYEWLTDGIDLDNPEVFINGPVEGYECTNEKGNCGCSHAEASAVISMSRWDANLRDAEAEFVMVQNYSPCSYCANLIVLSGVVKGVIWKTITEHDKRGLEILEKGGVQHVCCE